MTQCAATSAVSTTRSYPGLQRSERGDRATAVLPLNPSLICPLVASLLETGSLPLLGEVDEFL